MLRLLHAKKQDRINRVKHQKKILASVGVALSASFAFQNAFSEEGDTFQYQGVCHVELAGGSREKISCDTGKGSVNKTMTIEEKALNANMLDDFDESLLAEQVKLASWELNTKSQTEVSNKYPLEVMEKSKKLNNGKYLVKIIFSNEGGYPQKSSSTNKYFLSGQETYEQLNDAQAVKWDNDIATNFIGADYLDYQTSVDVVTRDNVIVTVALDDVSQLSGIIDGKNVRSIDHVGMPEVVYEEIIPNHMPN